jgi:hypothetical protein
VTAPRSAGALATARGSQPAPIDAADAAAAVALWHTPIAKRDAITLSARATALVRAGLAVRAYVMAGWENVRRLITLSNGRAVVFEHGLYSLVL